MMGCLSQPEGKTGCHMIHNERVRRMVQLQAFNDRKGKECFPVVTYFRKDYVGLHMLKGFLSGTIAYGVMLLMWAVSNMEMLMESIHTMDLKQFAISVLLRYLLFLVVYLAAVFVYAQTKYTRAKKELKGYNRHLKRLIGSFERDGGES